MADKHNIEEYTIARSLLEKHLHIDSAQSLRICNKVGFYGGAIDYLCNKLGITRQQAYEDGIIPFKPVQDQCDPEHAEILKEYRRIRCTDGITAANKYFYDKLDELKERAWHDATKQ